ncbi:unnamed protein product [Ectocarpus sp. CCAP 1310/34]|nr:unnamed protein product [Ectocarpus sp. CCAP 1310/34]
MGDGLASAVPMVSWPEHAEMEKGDVVVTVEHCHGCHRHRMTTRHDPQPIQPSNPSPLVRIGDAIHCIGQGLYGDDPPATCRLLYVPFDPKVYLSHANAVKELLIESLRELPVRLAVVLKKSPLRSRTLSPGGDGGGSGSANASATTLRRRRVGALEVQVAARHPNRGHQLHAQVIHSKLASGRWPRLGTSTCLPNRVRRALESWGFKTDKREIGGTRKDENITGEAGVVTKTNPLQTQTRKMIWYIVELRIVQHDSLQELLRSLFGGCFNMDNVTVEAKRWAQCLISLSSPGSADGAGADTPSAQHRPRPRVLIPWEFDNRDRMHRGDEVTTSRRQGARIPDKHAHTDGYNDNSKIRGGARTTPATAEEIATNNHDFHGKVSNKPTTSGENGSDTGNDGDRRRSGRNPERPGMTTTTVPDSRDDGCSPSRGREANGTVAAGVLGQENSSKAAEVGEDSVALVDGVATAPGGGADGKPSPRTNPAITTTTIAAPSSLERREEEIGTNEKAIVHEGIRHSQTVAPEAEIHFGDGSFEAAGLEELVEDCSAGGSCSHSNGQKKDQLSCENRGSASRIAADSGSCNNRDDKTNSTSSKQTPASSITGETGHQLEPVPRTGQDFTSGVVRTSERWNKGAKAAVMNDISDAGRRNLGSQPAVEEAATRGGGTREEQTLVVANAANATDDLDFHWESGSHSSCDRSSCGDSTTHSDPSHSRTDGAESLFRSAVEPQDSRTSRGGTIGPVVQSDSIVQSSSTNSNSNSSNGHRGRADVRVTRDAVGGPVRAEEGENDISAEEDEYDADFASQAEDSLVEEVDEDAADAAPGPPPFVAPKEIDSMHENDEEELEDAIWDQDAEEWEEEKKEEEVEEEEYGDDFDS